MKNKFVLFVALFVIAARSDARDVLAEKFFKDKTDLVNPSELRDPFVSSTGASAQTLKDLAMTKSLKQNYSNVTAPSILRLSDIKIIGIIIGPDKRAMAKVDGNTIVLREGMKVGAEGAELKAILPGGVIFVEKIVNIYGGEEFLESVIPVSLSAEK